jgi:hypothetical protein
LAVDGLGIPAFAQPTVSSVTFTQPLDTQYEGRFT